MQKCSYNPDLRSSSQEFQDNASDECLDDPANSRSALGDMTNVDGEERGLEDGGKHRQQPASLLGAMGVAGDADGEAKEGECKQS